MVTGLDSGRLSTAGALTLLLLALTLLIGSSETVAPTDEIASDRARAVLARESPPPIQAAQSSTRRIVRARFGGNNEDERNPLTHIWFVPGETGSSGSVFVGYDDLVVQGGMNEAGLFFDALGVREVEVPATPGKPAYSGQNLALDVMAGCDSVACVVEQFQSFSMDGTWNGQYLFGDRFGHQPSSSRWPSSRRPSASRSPPTSSSPRSHLPSAPTNGT